MHHQYQGKQAIDNKGIEKLYFESVPETPHGWMFLYANQLLGQFESLFFLTAGARG